MPLTFFIPGNVPSSKNGKIKTRWGLISSKATRAWQEATAWHWKVFQPQFGEALAGREKPYRIGFKFFRGTRHEFDYVNPLQTVQDEMVKSGWLEDDNVNVLLPVFLPYEYNPKKPGVEIVLL